MYEWNAINWKKIQIKVFKLQKRIYQASKRGDQKCAQRLQKLLLKSWSAKLLAVRKVSQDNKGKKTAGIDGVRFLTGKQRVKLVHQLSLRTKPKPVRRIWIPKSNSSELRPLGIPTLHDRAMQALVKLALEPYWEAKMETNSYGFRPGRSAHDAIAAVYTCINQRAKYVLDTDIEKCFDKINHTKLLDKLNTFPTLRQIISKWLKAGIMEKEVFIPVNRGISQGMIISPLLANIALHGIENFINEKFKPKRISRTKLSPKITLVRYADDLVVLHESKEVVKQCKELLNQWLNNIGLTLNEAKTKICHTLYLCNGINPGFNFLGMEIRQYKVGKTHSGRNSQGNLLGFKTIIKPSKASQLSHSKSLGEIIRRHTASSQAALIRELNPVIRGWCNYYSTVVSKDIFSLMDYKLYNKLRRWALRRHGYKFKRKIFRKYWRLEKGTWRFDTQEGIKIKYHSQTKIKRHVKVYKEKTPFDGDWCYWGKRLKEYLFLTYAKSMLLRQQKGKCALCQLNFTSEDKIEMDHRTPKILGGKNDPENCQLLHLHCHHQKTKTDHSQLARKIVNL